MRNRLIFIAYLTLIFLLALYAFKRPQYNWDMLPYMAVAIGYQDNNPDFVHDTIYDIARHQLPAPAYNQLIDGGLEYRRKMTANAGEFHRQMPFYTVKPLYTWLVYFIYKLGVPLIQATILPSLIGYLLIGALLILW